MRGCFHVNSTIWESVKKPLVLEKGIIKNYSPVILTVHRTRLDPRFPVLQNWPNDWNNPPTIEHWPGQGSAPLRVNKDTDETVTNARKLILKRRQGLVGR